MLGGRAGRWSDSPFQTITARGRWLWGRKAGLRPSPLPGEGQRARGSLGFLLHEAQLKPIPPQQACLGERMGMNRKRRTAPWGALLVQWVGLGAFSAQGLSSVPGRGPKIPEAEWCCQTKQKKKLPFKAYVSKVCNF